MGPGALLDEIPDYGFHLHRFPALFHGGVPFCQIGFQRPENFVNQLVFQFYYCLQVFIYQYSNTPLLNNERVFCFIKIYSLFQDFSLLNDTLCVIAYSFLSEAFSLMPPFTLRSVSIHVARSVSRYGPR